MKIGKRRRLERYKVELSEHINKCAICNGQVTNIDGPIHCKESDDMHRREGRI